MSLCIKFRNESVPIDLPNSGTSQTLRVIVKTPKKKLKKNITLSEKAQVSMLARSQWFPRRAEKINFF